MSDESVTDSKQSTNQNMYKIAPLSPQSVKQFSPLINQLSALSDDLSSELEEEFNQSTNESSQSNVDVASIKDICRYFLNEYLKITEKFMEKQKSTNQSTSQSNDQSIPDAIIEKAPLIAPELRLKIWKLTLGVANKDESMIDRWVEEQSTNQSINQNDQSVESASSENSETDQSTSQTPGSAKIGLQQSDIDQQKDIQRDVERTRSSDPRFLANQSINQSNLQSILSFYCRSRGVAYKQGLTEILAPIIMLSNDSSTNQSTNQSIGGSYNLFYSLISKFLPQIFNDTEFENLRLVFRIFHHLLNYFDPQLGQLFNQSNVLPELYATPWFITLFARDLNVDCLFFLWDIYLIDDDPFLHYFLALSLLIDQRDELLSLDAMTLPIKLRGLKLTNILSLLIKARALRDSIPITVRQRLYDIAHQVRLIDQMELINQYESILPCMRIPASEIVQQAYSDLAVDQSIKYIVLDCREKRQFEAGHLPCSIHINPVRLFDDQSINQLISEFDSMRGQHFCVIGAEMKSYQSIIQSIKHAHPNATEKEMLTILEQQLNAPSNQSINQSVRPSLYLLPDELRVLDDDDRRRSEAKKLKLGAGAPPPIAAPIRLASPSPTHQSTSQSPSKSTSQQSDDQPKGSSEQTKDQSADQAADQMKDQSDNKSDAQSNEPVKSTVNQSADQSITSLARSPSPSISQSTELTSSKPVVFAAISPVMDPYTASLIRILQSNNFTHVSVCEGGHLACHEIVMKIKVEREQAATQAKRKNSTNKKETPVVISQSIELVDHVPINCIACSPQLYEKWREAQTRKREQLEKQALKEKLAIEKRIAAEHAAAEKKALAEQAAAEKKKLAEQAALEKKLAVEKLEADKKAAAAEREKEIEAERQRRRDAGESEETINEAINQMTLQSTNQPNEKLNSLKRWFSEKKQSLSTPSADQSAAQSVNPTLPLAVAPPVAEPAESTNESEEEKKSQTDQSANQSTNQSASQSKFWSRAQSLAKKVSESVSETFANPVLSERDQQLSETISTHLSEKRAESETSQSINLADWYADPSINLFDCHEVRKIPGSTQGLLIPRVLAITDGYIIALRPQSTKTNKAANEQTVNPIINRSINQATNQSTTQTSKPGLFDRLSAAVKEHTSQPVTVPINQSINQPTNPSPDSVSLMSPSAPDRSIDSSAFSLAPTDDSLIDSASEQSINQSIDTSSPTIPSINPMSPSIPATRLPSMTEDENQSIKPIKQSINQFAYIHSKRKIVDLDKITSKKERPKLLTFHWKLGSKPVLTAYQSINQSSNQSNEESMITMYVLDRPRECISTVKTRYQSAKIAARDLAINQSIDQPISQSVDESTNQSTNQSVDQSINQSVDQSINQSSEVVNVDVKPSDATDSNQSTSEAVDQSIDPIVNETDSHTDADTEDLP